MLLATVGLYAVTAHGVGLRRQEFGIRMTLGASPARVVGLVLASLRVPLGLGLGLGIVGTLAWERAFPPYQTKLTITHPAVLASTIAMVGLVTFVACIVPTRRAAGLDPAAVLREE